ncbi:hypothetical protein EI534_10085 [Pseudomonas frederiksbergensis]|nr:hypothetical protein [Pseudomonas frederiksbergensis]
MVKRGMFSQASRAVDHLPFPALSTMQVRAVIEAFRLAWDDFMAAPECHGITDIQTANETALSDALLSTMATIHNSHPPQLLVFSTEFQTPVSDESTRNFDGSKRITKIDFCFRPKINPFPGRDPRLFGLFVEAKPVINGSISNAMRNGLLKFCIGDYAWAMTHGVMISYVRPTNKELIEVLTSYLSPRQEEFGLIDTPCHWPKDHHQQRICVTRHKRNWTYPDSNHRSPGDIEILHLWLPMAE